VRLVERDDEGCAEVTLRLERVTVAGLALSRREEEADVAVRVLLLRLSERVTCVVLLEPRRCEACCASAVPANAKQAASIALIIMFLTVAFISVSY